MRSRYGKKAGESFSGLFAFLPLRSFRRAVFLNFPIDRNVV